MRIFCVVWIQTVQHSDSLYAYLDDEEQYNLRLDLEACPDLTAFKIIPVKVAIGTEILENVGDSVSRAFVPIGRDVQGTY